MLKNSCPLLMTSMTKLFGLAMIFDKKPNMIKRLYPDLATGCGSIGPQYMRFAIDSYCAEFRRNVRIDLPMVRYRSIGAPPLCLIGYFQDWTRQGLLGQAPAFLLDPPNPGANLLFECRNSCCEIRIDPCNFCATPFHMERGYYDRINRNLYW
jgi:hypothetical protein